MKKLSLMVASVFALVAFGPVILVGAQDDTNLRDRATQVRPLQTDVRPDVVPIDRCEIVQTRIKRAINNIEQRAKNKIQKYEEIAQKVRRIIALAEEHGVDPSVLVEDLKVLDEKVQRFKREVRELISILETAHDLACNDDRERFHEALQKAREQLKVVRKSAADIREFVANVLIPHARAVLAKIQDQ